MKTEVFAKKISNVRQDQNDAAMIGNAWLTLNGVMEPLIALNQVNIDKNIIRVVSIFLNVFFF